MAEPWTADLTALGERSRDRLPSIAATRASVLSHLTQEPKMRLFHDHPVLSALLALVLLGVGAPLAYAVVDRVFIEVDPSKPAPEIQRDVAAQLGSAHVQADVAVSKPDDDHVQIRIAGSDVPADLPVLVTTGSDTSALALQVQVTYPLTPAQQDELQAALGSPAATALITANAPDLATELVALLAAQGFHGAEVTVAHGAVQVTIAHAP